MEEPIQNKTGMEGPGVRTGFLADAKRFNAKQIRRRMREQKDRFSPKLSSPSDGSQPVQNTTEEVFKPQLTIAVSMSEDQYDYQPNVDNSNDDDDDHDSEASDNTSSNDNDKSAWAMMEHYEIHESKPERSGDEEPLNTGRTNASFWDRALHLESFSEFSAEDHSHVSETNTSAYDDISQQVFVHKPTASPSTHLNSHPFQFQTPSTAILKPVTPTSDAEESRHTIIPWESAAKSTDPTPARLRRHWLEEKANASTIESPPTSLLQESLIMSDAPSSSGSAFHTFRSIDDSRISSLNAIPTVSGIETKTVHFDEGSQSQMSMAVQYQSTRSKPELKVDTESVNSETDDQVLHGLQIANAPSNSSTQQITFQPKPRIRSPKELQLQDRVEELEQALRASVATPRGTIVQENPLKTLLDRNQTLVKEVRFADSTCVELSTKIAAMEAERQIMQNQLVSLETENKNLRSRTTSSSLASYATGEVEQDIGSFTFTHVESTPEGPLRQIIDDLKAEVAALAQERKTNTSIISSASVLLTDIETLEQNEVNQSNASNYLAKALQLQVDLLKEQKQVSVRNEELEQELDIAKMENNLIREDLVRAEQGQDTEAVSKAEQQSDFLGRQLGHVQERLDEALSDLNEEKSLSKSIDTKWRNQTTVYLERIQLLEKQLNTATTRLSELDNLQATKSSTTVENAVANVEFELSDFKEGLKSFKISLEKLLDADAVEKTSSTADTKHPEVLLVVQATMRKVRQQLSRLHGRVDTVVDSHCERLEELTKMVSFLRSSLLFEAESVSTGNQESLLQMERSKATSLSREMDDDELFERMEEAREQPTHVKDILDEASSELDDLSRLFLDDSTFDLTKGNQNGGAFSNVEALKKPLEAALRECRRVKDRSLALKQELQTEKIAFAQLVAENKRVVRESNQHSDESNRLQHELDESQSRVQFLESRLAQYKEDLAAQMDNKEEMEKKYWAVEKEKKDLGGEKANLEYSFAKLSTELQSIKYDVRALSGEIVNKEDESRVLLARIAELQTQVSESEGQLLESKLDQENMRKERAEFKLLAASRDKEINGVQETVMKLTASFEHELQLKQDKIEAYETDITSVKETLGKYDKIFEELYDVAKASSEFLPVDVTAQGDSIKDEDGGALHRASMIAMGFSLAVQTIVESHEKKSSYEQDLLRLQQEFESSTEMCQNYKKQIGDEKSQNLKLLELLRQAEREMERSANQIREMSSALSKLQHQEEDLLSRTKTAEEESESVRKEFEANQRSHMDQQSMLQQRVNELHFKLQQCEKQEQTQTSQVELLEHKNSRLREYVKKLTLKCEEWEASYETQAKTVEKLQDKNSRLRTKSSAIASKYKSLSSYVKSRDQTQAGEVEKWDIERTDLQKVHEQLERELETITKELSNLN